MDLGKQLTVAVVTFGLAGSAVAQESDSVIEQLDLGRELYDEGDYSGAITELQFAINEIRSKLSELLAETFPEAPDGWEAAAAENQGGAAFMGGGSTLSRTYSETGGQGRIEAQLIADSPMIQGFAAMVNNPALLASQPNSERVRVGRENAILKYDPNNQSGEMNLVVAGRLMLQLNGRKVSDKSILEDLLKSWDLRTIKDLLAM